jgi:MFS family permease
MSETDMLKDVQARIRPSLWPSSGKAWTMTILLSLAYILSFVDRQILGLLIQPIKADMALSDEQLGYLIGWAFALFYATIGVPMGWLADRKRRTWIVATGIAVWSIATAASGLAKNFWHLFAARMAVGAGEATLSPCAMSMISDSFPPEKRGKPIALYSAALGVGSGMASIIGAGVLVWAKTSEGLTLPIVGQVAPWQFAFFVVGLPGLILSLAFFLLAEPPRQRDNAANAEDREPGKFKDALLIIFRDKAAYIGITSLVCVMAITAYSHSFMPAAFERTYGWEASDFAFANGLSTLLIGPASMAIIGWQMDRMRSKGITDAPIRILIWGFVLLVPTSALILLMPTAETALAVNAINTVPFAMVTAAGIVALLDITPGKVRAQTVALYYMAISVSGLLLGPWTAGKLSTRVFGEAHLDYAVSVVPIIYGLIPMLCLPIIRRAYIAKLDAPQKQDIFA